MSVEKIDILYISAVLKNIVKLSKSDEMNILDSMNFISKKLDTWVEEMDRGESEGIPLERVKKGDIVGERRI